MNVFKFLSRLGIAAAFCAGFAACASNPDSVTIQYVSYPSFFAGAGAYKTMVVAPTENAVDPTKYSQFVSTNVALKVQQNGSYKIINETKNTEATEEALAAKALAADPNALVMTSTLTNYGELKSSDIESFTAFDYQADSASASKSVSYGAGATTNSQYAYYDKSASVSGSSSRKSLELPVLKANKTVYANLNVVIKRASDGEIVLNEMVRGFNVESSFFGFNSAETEERIKAAFDEMTSNVVYYVCPTVETMTVNPNRILLVQGQDGGEWSEESSFVPGETVRIVFVMPPNVAYNDFSVIVVPEGGQPIVSENINYSGFASVFDYKAEDFLAAGTDKFIVKVLQNNAVLSVKPFKIKQQ